MTDNDSIGDILLSNDPGGIVVRRVAIGEIIGPDGTEVLTWRTSDGMGPWTLLGLLEWLAAATRAEATEGGDDE